jgi:hypothetical protein
MHLDLAQRGTSPTRDQPVDVPSVDGRMPAVGSAPAVKALPRHPGVPEKSTAAMQYKKSLNELTT